MKKLSNTTFSLAALILASTQVAPAAVFAFRIDNAGTTAGSPIDDGQNFQQQWGKSENWTLVSGVDDGDNGYPDGADTSLILPNQMLVDVRRFLPITGQFLRAVG